MSQPQAPEPLPREPGLRGALLELIASTVRAFIAHPSSQLDDDIQRTLAAVGQLFDADRAYVFVLCPDQASVSNTHEWCAPGVEPQIAQLQHLPESLFPWWMGELRAGRAIRLSRLQDLPPQAGAERDLLESQSIQSLLVLPLERRGRLEGFAGFDHIRGERRWSEEEEEVLRIVVGSFAQGFERQQLDRRLEQMAYEDPLTGLPNRILLRQRLDSALEQARVTGALLAIGYLDLDCFKAVNDAHGHGVGDRLLVDVARRLQQQLRPEDTLARLGGDEFVVILPGLVDREQARRLADQLLGAVARPWRLDASLEMQLTTSLGLRLVPPDDADADVLLRQADQAMYAAKRSGPGRVHLFDAALEQREQRRLARIREISRAIASGQLRLWVQPVVELRSGRVPYAEALVRWQHPRRGLLEPAQWLHLIHDRDEIISLGAWVLEQAIAQVSTWLAAELCGGISVNVSVPELRDPRFADRLAALLARFPGLPAGTLKLEVLETVAIEDLDQVLVTMQRCRDLGVGFSLDDFGTGYSSLTHLRQLPLVAVKIDRSFVASIDEQPADRAIVRSVVDLARAFGRVCVAEGVETPAQQALLLEMGCELGQGFGLARPMPVEAFPDWLRSRPAWDGRPAAGESPGPEPGSLSAADRQGSRA